MDVHAFIEIPDLTGVIYAGHFSTFRLSPSKHLFRTRVNVGSCHPSKSLH